MKKTRQKKNLPVKLAAALAALLAVSAAHAQDYPKRPITMIVPFAAGGTSDVIARVVAEEMTKSLGQPIVIENVAGAGGSTALTRAARAEADGYTIAIGNAGTSAAAYAIYPKLPFTPESFAPVAVVARPSASSRCARIFRRRTCRISSPMRRKIPARSISAMPASARRIS